jgi:ligand-binding sensor domain-containing protein/two-component sensor histidine kinase
MKPIFFSLFLSLISIQCSAQQVETKSDLIFSHLTTRDGLSFNDVQCVMKDSKGYMWFGTSDGLNKYNGQSFKIYKHDFRNKNSLIDNRTTSIAEDKNGFIWIGTQYGLSKLNPETDTFENFQHDDNVKESLAGNFKVIVYCDVENNLWCGSHGGLDLFNRTLRTFTHFPIAASDGESEKSISTITCIFRDSKKRLWVGTLDGLFLLNEKEKMFRKFGTPHSNPSWTLDNVIECVFEDHAHQLWLGTWGGGLKKFFPEENRTESFYYAHPSTMQSTTNVILSIAEAKNIHGENEMWVSTNGGVMKFNEQQKNFSFYVHNDLNSTSPLKNASLVYCDNTNLLWCAGENGIDILDDKNQFFTTHYFNQKFSGAFQQQFGEVKVFAFRKNKIWAGAWFGNGLYCLNENFEIEKTFVTLPPQNTNKESSQVNDIFVDSDSTLWICTFGGLVHFVPEKNSWKLFSASSKNIPSNRITHFFCDSKGIYWISFYRSGLYWFDKNTEKFSLAFSENPKLHILDIAEDENKNVWLATEDRGLLKFSHTENKLINYPCPKYAPDFTVNGLMFDNKNRLWCSTRKGISIVDLKIDSVEFLTSAEGLSSDNVNGTLQDKSGRIWIATSNGLNVYDEEKKMIRVFYKADGLPADGINAAFTKNNSGKFLLAGTNFITEFLPDSLPENNFAPPVRITSAEIFGDKIPFYENEKHEKFLNLNWQQKQISFAFDVLNFLNPSKNKFFCKLDGFDKEWHEVKNGVVNFTNLDANDYVFRVRGANNDGVLNETGDYVLLKISPPFWKTAWFYLLCIVLVSSALYTAYRYRLNQLLKMERMRTRIATDLHDDIGATLSTISMMTHIAEQSDVKTEKEFLQNIGENSRALIDRMDDIVWSLKPSNDSLEKIFTRLRNYALPLMNAKNISFRTEFSDALVNKKIGMNERQNIYLIAKEAINNLLKYSQCTEAKLEMNYENGKLILLVDDNGKGISEIKIREGNGLLNMKQRVEQLHAELKIESEPMKGTKIELNFKIG